MLQSAGNQCHLLNWGNEKSKENSGAVYLVRNIQHANFLPMLPNPQRRRQSNQFGNWMTSRSLTSLNVLISSGFIFKYLTTLLNIYEIFSFYVQSNAALLVQTNRTLSNYLCLIFASHFQKQHAFFRCFCFCPSQISESKLLIGFFPEFLQICPKPKMNNNNNKKTD